MASAVGARRCNDIHIAVVTWPRTVLLIKLIPTEDGLFCFRSAKAQLRGWTTGMLCWPDGQRGIRVIDTSEDQQVQVLVANRDGDLSWSKFRHHTLDSVRPLDTGFVEHTEKLMSDFKLWSRARVAAPGAKIPRSHIVVRGSKTSYAVFGADIVAPDGERSVHLVFVDVEENAPVTSLPPVPISPMCFAPSDVLVGMVWRTEHCYAFAFAGHKYISLLDAPHVPTRDDFESTMFCQHIQILHAKGAQLEEKRRVTHRVRQHPIRDGRSVLGIHRRALDEVQESDAFVIAQKWHDHGFFVYSTRVERAPDQVFSFVDAARTDWFLNGVAQLIAEDSSFPYRSDGVSKRLWTVHDDAPMLLMYFEYDEPGTGHVIPVRTWESAGVWADEDGDVCLVILAKFEDGPEMYCLYDEYFVTGRKPSAPREWSCA